MLGILVSILTDGEAIHYHDTTAMVGIWML